MSPKRKRLNRKERLKSAKKWLDTYEGKSVIHAYVKWFGVNMVCAIIELRMCGIEIPEQKLIDARASEERKRVQNAKAKADKAKKKLEMERKLEWKYRDSDEHYAFIAGYTTAGFAYGITHEEWEQMELNEMINDYYAQHPPPCDIPPTTEE